MSFLKSCLLGRQGSVRSAPRTERASGWWVVCTPRCGRRRVRPSLSSLIGGSLLAKRKQSKLSAPRFFRSPDRSSLEEVRYNNERRLNDSTIAGLLVVNLPFAVDSGHWLSGFAQLPRKQPRGRTCIHTHARSSERLLREAHNSPRNNLQPGVCLMCIESTCPTCVLTF